MSSIVCNDVGKIISDSEGNIKKITTGAVRGAICRKRNMLQVWAQVPALPLSCDLQHEGPKLPVPEMSTSHNTVIIPRRTTCVTHVACVSPLPLPRCGLFSHVCNSEGPHGRDGPVQPMAMGKSQEEEPFDWTLVVERFC